MRQFIPKLIDMAMTFQKVLCIYLTIELISSQHPRPSRISYGGFHYSSVECSVSGKESSLQLCINFGKGFPL